jgi:hypothetical protein
MVNGSKDDASHAHICEEYGKKMLTNGADIKVTTKKNWGHGFEANYEAEYESAPRKMARLSLTIILKMTGHLIRTQK